MHCIDPNDRAGAAGARRRRLLALWAGAALAASCSSPAPPPPPAAPAPAPVAAPATPATTPSVPAAPAAPVGAAPRSGPGAARVPLPPMPRARNWDEFRRLAARRIVDATPHASYTGRVPEPLLAIPVLEVELNADGSVRRIDVLRRPGQAHDTVQLAIDAVHRAAPFSDVSRLPRPWRYTEVFLFDDQRRFKPRTLDQP